MVISEQAEKVDEEGAGRERLEGGHHVFVVMPVWFAHMLDAPKLLMFFGFSHMFDATELLMFFGYAHMLDVSFACVLWIWTCLTPRNCLCSLVCTYVGWPETAHVLRNLHTCWILDSMKVLIFFGFAHMLDNFC